MKNRVLYIKQCRICSVCGAVKQKERNSMTVGHKFRSNLIACDEKTKFVFSEYQRKQFKEPVCRNTRSETADGMARNCFSGQVGTLEGLHH
jgi:hypothetical protein